jgi:hypothetical protein
VIYAQLQEQAELRAEGVSLEDRLRFHFSAGFESRLATRTKRSRKAAFPFSAGFESRLATRTKRSIFGGVRVPTGDAHEDVAMGGNRPTIDVPPAEAIWLRRC